MGRAFIREQVLYHAPVARGNGFILDGHHMRVLSLKELPQQTAPGMFAPVSALFDGHQDILVAFNFVVPDQDEALGRLKFQKTFAFIQRTSSMGDVSEEAVQKKEELSGLITQIFKSGNAIVQARVHVVVLSEGEARLEQACDSLIVQFHRFGAGVLKEEIVAPSLFLTCLPLNFDHRLENFVRRDRRMLSDNFADMLPLYGAMRGTQTPAALYLNRRGEPVGVDLFDSETNPHAVIIGASGAGKSFLTNDLIYQNYRLGGHFFVLDKGHSYRKTCQVLGGQYIHFDLKAPLTINPFVAPPTAENLAFLVEVLALMASGGDDRDRLAREEKGFLQQAVLEAYGAVRDREVVLSDVVNVLRGDMGARLSLRLAPFTKNGQYGKFFDGPNAFVVDTRFTVFELAELSAYPDLQLVVLLNIMFFVTQFVSSEKLRAERKFLLIDEAWQLLKMANTADFIANAFKTFRKYRCAALAITQEVSDLLQQKSGLAILANTANKIFLKQEASVVEQLKKELFLSDEVAALLRSVRTVKGKYSEALMMTPSSTGVVRLVPDPFLYWAATSEPRDNACLEEARQRLGGDLLLALAHCAETYPYGVR
jgi:conjugal transfer ATP-binding protein TraC